MEFVGIPVCLAAEPELALAVADEAEATVAKRAPCHRGYAL
jgi:hypothetical protein